MRPLPNKHDLMTSERNLTAGFERSGMKERLHKLWAENRFEEVALRYCHHFINDCFASDLNDVLATIDALPGSVIWINYAPRLAKDYRPVIPLVKSKVRAVFTFGMEPGFVFKSMMDLVELFVQTGSLTDAMIKANLYARDNEYIVFAPGAEYDGREEVDWVWEFKEALEKLKPKIY